MTRLEKRIFQYILLVVPALQNKSLVLTSVEQKQNFVLVCITMVIIVTCLSTVYIFSHDIIIALWRIDNTYVFNEILQARIVS